MGLLNVGEAFYSSFKIDEKKNAEDNLINKLVGKIATLFSHYNIKSGNIVDDVVLQVPLLKELDAAIQSRNATRMVEAFNVLLEKLEINLAELVIVSAKEVGRTILMESIVSLFTDDLFGLKVANFTLKALDTLDIWVCGLSALNVSSGYISFTPHRGTNTLKQNGVVVSQPSNFDSKTVLSAIRIEQDKSGVTAAPDWASFDPFNISLFKDGVEAQPTGKITVSIPVPDSYNGNLCNVYRVEPNGSKTNMNARYENGQMVFDTNHLSIYVIALIATPTRNFTWITTPDNKITITGYIGTATNVVIPSVIEGKPVTRIGGNAFDTRDFVLSVTIPNSVTSIGAYAFFCCRGLTALRIPSSVKTLEDSAFRGCFNLQTVIIENGVKTIEYAAFWSQEETNITVHIPPSVAIIGGANFSSPGDRVCSDTENEYLKTTFGNKYVVCDGVHHGVWKGNTVVFDAQGGICSILYKTVKLGDAYGSLPMPTRAGYYFHGWYTEKNGAGTHIQEDALSTSSASQLLYARWVSTAFIQFHRVYFDSQGGSDVQSKDVTYSSVYGELPTPTKTGYTFSGWYTEPNGGGALIAADMPHNLTVNQIDRTLYAKWIVDASALTAAKNNKIAAINAIINGLNSADYTTASWQALQTAITNAIAQVNAATTVEAVNSVPLPSTSSLIRAYALTVNSGSGGGSYAANAIVTITANSAPSGKVFDKWTTSDGVSFANANAATTTFTMPGKNVSVTATYKDTGGGGTVAPGKKMIFSTKYEATFLNWILFFLCFGFIWMWF